MLEGEKNNMQAHTRRKNFIVKWSAPNVFQLYGHDYKTFSRSGSSTGYVPSMIDFTRYAKILMGME